MSVRVAKYRTGGWEVDIRIRLPNGERHRERRVVSHDSKSAAKRWAQDRERHLLQHGPDADKEVPTFAEFEKDFLDYARTEREKPSTIASKESILRCHLIPVVGRIRLDALTPKHVAAVKKAMQSRKPKTVNNALIVLKAMIRVAVGVDAIRIAPCDIPLLDVPQREMTFYDFAEFDRVVAAADDTASQLVVLLGGEAGLRCGEMIALEWNDVDFHSKQLSIARSDWEGQVTDTKGGKIRYLPLTSRLLRVLKAHRHLRAPRVLCRDDGSAMTQKAIEYLAKRTSKRAGVNKHGVHILRHTFCSHLAMLGGPAKAIQELAGHADLSTTMRYMHLSPASRNAAIKLLERGDIGEAAEAKSVSV